MAPTSRLALAFEVEVSEHLDVEQLGLGRLSVSEFFRFSM
jgi:hypothetical protein